MDYEFFNPYQDLPPQQQPINKYPTLYPTSNDEYKAIVDRFGFWKVTSLQGMLQKVTLPTGGLVKFTYGNHQYGEERQFRVVGNRDVELYSVALPNQSIGGVRIEKIETLLDDSTLVETKQYSYTKKGTSISSGIFYNNYEIFYSDDLNAGYPIANPLNYGTLGSHIGYSYVEQTTTSGNQTYKTAYSFYTGTTDYSSVENPTINRMNELTDYNDSVEVSSGSLTYPEKISSIGNLLAVEEYKGNLINRSILYSYNGIQNQMQGMLQSDDPSLGCTDTIVVLSTYSGLVARKMYIYPNVMEQIITRDYDALNNAFIQEKTCTYDQKLRQKTIKTTDSQGIKHFTHYTYPDDIVSVEAIPTSQSLAIQFLLKKFQIQTPVEITKGYITDNNECVTNAVINLYDKHMYVENTPTRFSPQNVTDSLFPQNPIGNINYLPYLSRTLSLASSVPITDYHPIMVQGDSIIHDSRLRLECAYLFDTHNRLISIKPYGKKEVKYTWLNRYALYPASIMTGNQKFTYTYIPYVGVESVTDPRGNTTYYTYDSAGRLIEEYQIIDGNKRILNAYQYHLKTE